MQKLFDQIDRFLTRGIVDPYTQNVHLGQWGFVGRRGARGRASR